MTNSARDISFVTLQGAPFTLGALGARAILVVNTASKCGFTPQYAGLETLYQTYKERGLAVLGVPSNDFGGQEPGSNEDITQFCDLRFHVTFPMTQKVKVTGAAAHPFYRWLAPQVGIAGKPRWNFYKYLLDGSGEFVDWFSAITKPEAGKVRKAIEKFCQPPR
jgi:glutathione peroxidase